tara:strand:+ start:3046 stop:3795 length:750 start_codon:yes stop_codon:yes gene_type:complete
MIELTQDKRPDQQKPLAKPDQLGPVRAWSYSTLKKYEDCPYSVYIAKVKKIVGESGPAAQRGTEIHQQAEDYVNGTLGKMPDTLHKFKDEFETLRRLYTEAKVELEGEWGFSLDWESVGWMQPNTWARIKLDALVNEDETSARVIDYKTGKKFGNEIAHGQQALLYAIATFMRYAHLEYIQTEMWYLDKQETTIKGYTRDQAMIFMPGIHQRAIAMTTAERFDPTPSKTACRWCDYRKGEFPECTWGVE